MLAKASLGTLTWTALLVLVLLSLGCSGSGDAPAPVSYHSGEGILVTSGSTLLQTELRQSGDAGAFWQLDSSQSRAFEVQLTSQDGRTMFAFSATVREAGRYEGFDAQGPNFARVSHIECEGPGLCPEVVYDSRVSSAGCDLVLDELDEGRAVGTVTCTDLRAACPVDARIALDTTPPRPAPGPGPTPTPQPSGALCGNGRAPGEIDVESRFHLLHAQAGATLTAVEFGGFPSRERPEEGKGGNVTMFHTLTGSMRVSGSNGYQAPLRLAPEGGASFIDGRDGALDRLLVEAEAEDGQAWLSFGLELDGPGNYPGLNDLNVLVGESCDGGKGNLDGTCRWYSALFSRGDCSVTLTRAGKTAVAGSLTCRQLGANCAPDNTQGRDANGVCLDSLGGGTVDVTAEFQLADPANVDQP
jgi:hypothetical protein